MVPVPAHGYRYHLLLYRYRRVRVHVSFQLFKPGIKSLSLGLFESSSSWYFQTGSPVDIASGLEISNLSTFLIFFVSTTSPPKKKLQGVSKRVPQFQSKAKQSKAKQSKAKQSKAKQKQKQKQSKAKQSKSKSKAKAKQNWGTLFETPCRFVYLKC